MSKVLIWLGAGQVETPRINFDKFETVLLVEARLEQVEKLRKQFSKDDNVKILHVAISDTAQKSDFNRYSLGEFSAFSSATGLKELYPGLKLQEREEVNTQAITDVLNDYIVQPASITLVLDILDINHLILESLFSIKFWQNINKLYLPIPELSLYENASTAPELLSLLQSQGFELTTTDCLDPDMPIAEMHRNPMWSELELVKEQLQLQKGQHQKEIEEYKSQLLAQNNEAEKAMRDFTQSLEKQSVDLKKVVETNNKLKSELEETNQQKTDLIKSLEKRLESDKLASKGTVKQLQTDKQQLIETYGKTKEENEQQHQKLLSQVQTLQAEKKQVTSNLEQLKINFSTLELEHKQHLEESSQAQQSFESEKGSLEFELSSLKTELEERTQQRDEQAHWHQENKKWAEGLNKKVESLEVSLKASNETLNSEQTEKQQLETKVDELNTNFSVLESEHKQHLEESSQAQQSFESEKDSLEFELSSLKTELEERTQQRDEQAHWHEENKKWAKALSVKCEELKNTVYEREKSTVLAIKLQTKAQLDLDDLRKRYQLKHSREQELVELIKELRQKLQQAAEFYHFLQDKHPELEFTSNSQTTSAEKPCLDSDSDSES
ncbi:MAG: hypothetical protein ABJH06_05775 [Paraglaciecola sp.]|uniref:hypothetical protein n=1 Tax=Paraglaciecola sp. TaxID=1920173 RepID=UPI0032972B73